MRRTDSLAYEQQPCEMALDIAPQQLSEVCRQCWSQMIIAFSGLSFATTSACKNCQQAVECLGTERAGHNRVLRKDALFSWFNA